MKIFGMALLAAPLALAWGNGLDQERTFASFEEARVAGAMYSKYKKQQAHAVVTGTPEPDLATFRAEIGPILEASCYECHGEKKQKADFRVDELDPNLIRGDDVDWWLEVVAVLTNGEMPPEDDEDEESRERMADDDRSAVIDWLSDEIQLASQVRRSEQGHSSFRRMTRYEYNYALQDLLGLPFDFAKDLPPDPVSEDGFKNSSEMLQMTSTQYGTYLELNRAALNRATVRGERPEMLFWGISAKRAATRKAVSVQQLDAALGLGSADDAEAEVEAKEQAPQRRNGRRGDRGDPSKTAHYLNTETGELSPATWAFRRAVNAWAPTTTLPEVSEPNEYIAVLPAGQELVVELGNRLPDEGTLRVRVRASRVSDDAHIFPSLALEFGWQGSNNSRASVRISDEDLLIDAPPGKPKFYQWDIPLSEIYPRNPVRKLIELGTRKRTNPSEYLRLHNTSLSNSAEVHFDYVEVSTPVYEQWPPASHERIFIESKNSDNENAYAWEIVSSFMARAWRRSVTDAEVDVQMANFERIRPICEDFQQAVIEVLATVLSSPRFLYLVQTDQSESEEQGHRPLDQFELATRLSMFLWCSAPDEELLQLASKGRLGNSKELKRQTKRMLADPKHERFSKQFVRQWLDMELLDYLTIDDSAFPEFDSVLQESMRGEPVAFFEEVLQNDSSVLDFIHADYALVDQRLAQHYGIGDVYGNDFRKVSLKPSDNRGGLLTQSGLLAMNSDGKDSHPLKRGVWLLESILNDPPPPPPPAVPEIDLADPDILKLTLKERMEDHRSNPACVSCHVKIDPWGIAFENFDAVGRWRTEHRGKEVDASSLLFNQHELDGMDGLKHYLLLNRQDQFTRAMVHKMATFALGRPLSFADRSGIEGLTAELRKEGDGLATLVNLLVTSDLFKSR